MCPHGGRVEAHVPVVEVGKSLGDLARYQETLNGKLQNPGFKQQALALKSKKPDILKSILIPLFSICPNCNQPLYPDYIILITLKCNISTLCVDCHELRHPSLHHFSSGLLQQCDIDQSAFSLTNIQSLLQLLPFLKSPSDDISVTMSMTFVIFINEYKHLGRAYKILHDAALVKRPHYLSLFHSSTPT